MNFSNMSEKEIERELRRIIAEELNIQIKNIVTHRLDTMQEQLNKLEKIDSIINNIKELFGNKQ